MMKLSGGLGNQLFQYAVGKQLAIKNNTCLKLDISYYQSSQNRMFMLGALNIKADVILNANFDKFVKDGLWSRILNNSNIVKEKYFGFNRDILNLGDNIYLDGYWQSEKYFKDVEEEIANEVTLKKPFSKAAAEINEKIRDENSVSIHIRRGDYLLKKHRSIYAQCPMEYYEKAIKLLEKECERCNYFVFSDDIDWAKKNLPKSYQYEFVSQSGITDCEELVLMSHCRHNITANSTFSWWGAWLNKDKFKIVITPEKWFNDKRSTSDLIPDTWLQI